MDRLTKFNELKEDAMLGRLYKKLTANELIDCTNFIQYEAKNLDKGSFELAVNRMYLDQPKPKHWKEILELLTCANSKI